MMASLERSRSALFVVAAVAWPFLALAQPAPALQPPPGPPPVKADSAPATAAKATPPPASLDSLGWLAGCWRGNVNQREFREQWMPLRGDLMVGVGHTVNAGKTQDYEYLRLEPRADGVYYVALPSGQKETAFRLASVETDGGDTIFTFANPAHDFPQRIVYRRGTLGWLYVHIEGPIKGEERRIIYPFRRIDCESGELVTS